MEKDTRTILWSYMLPAFQAILNGKDSLKTVYSLKAQKMLSA